MLAGAIFGDVVPAQIAAGVEALQRRQLGLRRKLKEFDNQVFAFAEDRLEAILRGSLGDKAADAVIGNVARPVESLGAAARGPWRAANDVATMRQGLMAA